MKSMACRTLSTRVLGVVIKQDLNVESPGHKSPREKGRLISYICKIYLNELEKIAHPRKIYTYNIF